jgi:hypothetical protein
MELLRPVCPKDFFLRLGYIKNNSKVFRCIRNFRLTFLFSVGISPPPPQEIGINISSGLPILVSLYYPTHAKAWYCLIFTLFILPTNPSSPSACSIMQLDSTVKVIALSFLSVLVDAHLSHGLLARRRLQSR